MRLKRLLIGSAIVVLLAAGIVLALGPIITANAVRGWIWWQCRDHRLTAAIGAIHAPLLKPVVIENLQIRSNADAGWEVDVAVPRIEAGLDLRAIMTRSDKRLLQSLAVLDARVNLAAAPGGQPSDWKGLLDLLADKYSLEVRELEIRTSAFAFNARGIALSASEYETGRLAIEHLQVSAEQVVREFSSIRGATDWQNNRLTIGAIALARGIDLDVVTLDFGRLPEGVVSIESAFDLFGGRLRATLSVEQQDEHAVWNIAANVTRVSLSQLTADLPGTSRAGGTLTAGKFTFRGDPAALAHASASVWFEAVNLTWRDRAADTIMIGAWLHNDRAQIEQIYVKQRDNQLTFSGEAVLPSSSTDWLKPTFSGRLFADLSDLGEFARLFGGTASAYSGQLRIEADVKVLNGEPRGTLTATGERLLIANAPVESLDGAALIAGSTLTLQRLDFQTEAGPLRFTGSARIADPGKIEINLEPDTPLRASTDAEPGSCLGAVTFLAPIMDEPGTMDVERLEIAGAPFRGGWSLRLEAGLADDPALQGSEARMFRLCRGEGSRTELRLAPPPATAPLPNESTAEPAP